MRFLKSSVRIVLAAALFSAAASRADAQNSASNSLDTSSLHFGAAPAWVTPIALPGAAGPGSGGLQVLLQDHQCQVVEGGNDCYAHIAARATNANALRALGLFKVEWDPSTTQITIHAIRVIRGATSSDVLNGGKGLAVLRRESNLERAVLDGRLTATQQLEDLQVGDILEYAVTYAKRDRALEGRTEVALGFTGQASVSRVYWRLMWPDRAPVHWRTTSDLPPPKVTHAAGRTELVEDITDFNRARPAADLPRRYQQGSRLELTEFADWTDLSRFAAHLFAGPSELRPDSPLKAEAAKIKAAASSPEDRAALALALVEKQVRYLFVGLNDGGYLPASADDTWKRKYGDCKAKTVLLLALLKELGIEAEPVLTHTVDSDGLDGVMPMLYRFNHVLVHAHVGDRWFWLDGTRPGDPKALEQLEPPNLEWGLPSRPSGSGLVKFDRKPAAAAQVEVTETVQAPPGLQGPSPATVVAIWRGDQGLLNGLRASAASHAAADQAFRQLVGRFAPKLDIETLTWSYDEANLVFTLRAVGSETLSWRQDASGRSETEFSAGKVVGIPVPARRTGEQEKSLPYAEPYPYAVSYHGVYIMPEHGTGFTLEGKNFQRTMFGTSFDRKVDFKDGVLHLDVSAASVDREFAAADLAPSLQALNELNSDPVRLFASAKP